jgi:hypothetical protein
MRLLIKKMYCPHCQRLIKGKEESVNGLTHVNCSVCNRPIWSYNGIHWSRL